MRQVLVLAIVFMLLWVVAVPLLYLVLLLRCRGAILAHQPTGLSRNGGSVMRMLDTR